MNNENVNHPSHYQGTKFEVIDIIEDFNLDFELGNAVKYILRAGKKQKTQQAYIEDLKKSIWYLQRKVDKLSKPVMGEVFVEVCYGEEKIKTKGKK